MPKSPTDANLRDWLKQAKRIAVIGLSPQPSRPSHGVTQYMIRQGYEIFGVRPGAPATVLGRPCVERLDQLTEDVDLFDVFRNPDSLPGVVDDIESWLKKHPARPRTLWLQEGVTHPQAEARARSLGLNVVSDLCILKEHARLLGRG